jgi:hypothetical protein
MSRFFMLAALVGLGFLPATVKAGPTAVPKDAVKAAANQFYGPWEEGKNYWFRSYYFKVSPTDKEFQEHAVLFYKKDPRFYYYYNPEKGQFWGRGFVGKGCHGEESYQFLPPGERGPELKDVNFGNKAVTAPPNLGDVNPPDKGAPAGTPADKGPAITGASGSPDKNLAQAVKGPRLKLPPDEPPPAEPFGG